MNDKNEPLDWADVRVFLAIVDGGNLGQAAEALDLSQPTVGRRLAAFEERLGTHLFARAGRRMVVTDAGEAILESARVMQREMDGILRTIAGEARGLAGVVTISATEGTGSEWLIPVLGSLRASYPEIAIRLQIESRAVNLVAREADIALRLGRPSQLDLVSRKLADIGFGIYADRSWLEQHGPVSTPQDLAGAAWVRGEFGVSAHDLLDAFLEAHQLEGRTSLATNSPTAQIAAVAIGLGVGILSHRWASRHAGLVPLLPELRPAEVSLWLVTHEDLRHSARIRAVADHIVARAEADRERFANCCREAESDDA